jgi:hypothetical protein
MTVPQDQGSLEQRYAIYVEAMRALGKVPVSFDEWLNR